MPRAFFLIFIAILILLPTSVFADNPLAMKEHEIININSIALATSQLTGMAISPLLVTGIIGAYKYYNLPSEHRSSLPWYFQPWFFIMCLAITVPELVTAVIKMTGVEVTGVVNKVADTLKIFNKTAGLLLATPVLLDIINPFAALTANHIYEAMQASNTYMVYASSFPTEWLYTIPLFIWGIITAICMFFVFIAIWLFNMVFDFLIFLCPFGQVEIVLKAIRGTYFAFLIGLTFINPLLGFLMTLPLIIVSLLMFAWSVRRTVMGVVYMKDILSVFSKKPPVTIGNKGVLAFSEAGLKMAKKRIGWLKEEDGKWKFTYRRFFLFKKTKTADKFDSVLRKGFFYSDVRNNKLPVCSLPPRYQKIDSQIQSYLNIDRFEETAIKRGLKAALAWLKEIIVGKPINVYVAA